MTLDQLQSGQRGFIIKVRGRGAFRKRITEMGFIKGEEVEVIKNAPLKDPIEYRILGYNITLRKSEASLIEVISPCVEERTPCSHECHDQADRNPECPDREPDPLSGHGHAMGRFGRGRGPGRRMNRLKRFRSLALNQPTTIHVALVGNPNSGKTTIFNEATGNRERVGNYAGVTVGAKIGGRSQEGYAFDIADLPGTYSITEYSPEELFVRSYLIEEKPDIIINIVDASNLARNLYLTTQLIDLDIPIVLALNMHDEMTSRGDRLDHETLGKLLGIPIVPTVGSRHGGIDELFRKVIDVYENRDETVRHIHVNYGHDIEGAIASIQEHIKNEENYHLTDSISSRFLAIKLLESDREIKKIISDSCSKGSEILETAKLERIKLESHLAEDSETAITDARYAFIAGALKETLDRREQKGKTLSEKIDAVMTHRYLGFPIFLFLMWITFSLTFSLGEIPMTWIENGIAFLSLKAGELLAEGIFKELVINGVLAGVGGVIVFLPNILILFFMISIMEDSGYMARSAFIMDKLMHKIGLHGKSFIPMIMGFGCNVPAIMATRTIESRSDRLLTMMIIPFMSCSARLPVFVLLIGAFFSSWSGTMLFLVYTLGIFFAILSSLFLKKTLFKKNELPFVMELPPYRRPRVKTSLQHMWDKGAEYLKKIGGIILAASILVWALGRFPLETSYSRDYDNERSVIVKTYESHLTSARMTADERKKLEDEKNSLIKELNMKQENERLEHSYIGRMGKILEPVFAPLGFNWKMGVSLITGLAAKEIIVSTMGVLYQVETDDEGNGKLANRLKTGHALTPGDVMTTTTAFGFIIFVLLYFPCFGAMAAIKKESGSWKWPLLSAAYTTGVAWIAAFLVYRIGSVFF